MDESLLQKFIQRWQSSEGAERANYGLFLAELCDMLEVPRPDPAQSDDTANAYVFDRTVTFHHGDGTTSIGFIDLYRRGAFVLEAKQGVEKRTKAEALAAATIAKLKSAKKGTATRGTTAWDEAMLKARGQAEQYARGLPPDEGRPPFLVIVDVGHSIELYSEFTRTGGTYVPFPDPRSHRLRLGDLANPEVREKLRLVWTDPLALDPSRRSAKVTRQIAEKLGKLAQHLEAAKHPPQAVAAFLMRALFTMFAEDVDLLPKNSFLDLLKTRRGRLETFVPKVEELWEKMNTGGFSNALDLHVRQFNGNLFADARALPLANDDQLDLLIEAAAQDWTDVEPAIFGTLLERALDPVERHKLGAHYTPRAYVERLVIPTVVEPLRAEWDAAKAAAITLDRAGERAEAIAEVQRFHRRLCEVRVLDPACGSGNFLYVTLEHLKRIEGEVLAALDLLGHEQAVLEMESFAVLPRQLLGIEVNPRAAAIAELVLWIGHLQWHFRTRGKVMPPEPIITAFHNIECRDAVLAWDATEPVLDEQGQPVTRWDGRTMKKHPVTGEDVPDETAHVPVVRYIDSRKSEWPQAEFIVGNPPYLGARRIRLALGNEYLDALRSTYPEVPDHADYVMYWWNRSAAEVSAGQSKQFGLITTNSISQAFSRKLLETHLDGDSPFSLPFVIPDHPWVDSANGAAVRIAMTVGRGVRANGTLQTVTREFSLPDGEVAVALAAQTGKILADLRIGIDILDAGGLVANDGLSCVGYQLSGQGFSVSEEDARQFGLGRIRRVNTIVRPLVTGTDLTRINRGLLAIDLYGLEKDEVRQNYPEIYQWVVDRVKPERDQNNRASVRERWWVFGEARSTFRPALAGLSRLIATSLTARHRTFVFYDAGTICDSTTVMFALDDGFHLGVLSSRTHICWSLRSGGRLGVGNDPRYTKARCFEPFPFPVTTDAQKTQIRDLGEAIDAHRKRQQALHPKLTLTDMYNVLQALRAGTPLSAKEQIIHEQGLVSVLRQTHDELDAAVAEAYGWPTDITDEEILTRLVALNAERAAEERRGLIRWLRPEFQNATGTATQTGLNTGSDESNPAAATPTTGKRPWPKTLPEQAQAVRAQLVSFAAPATPEAIAVTFKGARADRIEDLLETLASLGQARALRGGEFVAV